jgi:DNA-binding FadR family transcriptional regulator
MPRVADRVFDQLAAAILRGELLPQSPLPSERLLGQRFKVSRIIVRQAVHRLAELGLVRARQGEATWVLDPAEATDLRVLALFYRLAPEDAPGGPSVADMIEKQYLQGLSMVSAASRRAPPEPLARLGRLVQAFSDGEYRRSPLDDFEERYWRALSKAAGNRIFIMEVAWWYDLLRDRPIPARVQSLPRKIRLGFYAELTRRLLQHDRPVEYYLEITTPILDALASPRR